MKRFNLFMILMVAAVAFLSSCSDDAPAPSATVTYTPLTATNAVDGDVVGSGGSTTKSYTWNNSASTAEVNMDITTSQGGSMKMVILDADGNVVLDEVITSGSTDDSFSGVTSIGSPGAWTITVTMTSFSGDGSFSLSQGT